MRYQRSKSWEVVFLKNNFWGFLSLEVSVVSLRLLFSLFWSWLGSESQKSRVTQVHFNLSAVVNKDTLLDGFLLSLVFFGFNKSQLFFLKPFSVDFTSDWSLLLGNRVDIDTLALIVLSKSWFWWLLWFSLFNWNFFSGLGWDFTFRLFIFVLVKFILGITNISVSSTFFSWSVLSTSSTSSIKWMSSWNSFNWSVTISLSFTLIVWLFSFWWNFSINNNILSVSSFWLTLFFKLSSFFVSLDI